METLTEFLLRIRDSLAIIRRHRPGWKERFAMDPCWTEEYLQAFENRHRCSLPAEYREFIRLVGTAGAGPHYGLYAPHQHFPGSGFVECLEEDVDLTLPFPYMDEWTEPPGEEEGWEDEYYSLRHVHGSLRISDRGCALSDRIIITGPLAGEIWHDDRADCAGFRPALAPDGTRYTFLRWYLNWLDIVFYAYGHDGPMKQLRPEDSEKAKAIGANYFWLP